MSDRYYYSQSGYIMKFCITNTSSHSLLFTNLLNRIWFLKLFCIPKKLKKPYPILSTLFDLDVLSGSFVASGQSKLYVPIRQVVKLPSSM